jgi:DNA-binding response OmpR family regulator
MIHPTAHEAKVDNKAIELTAKEFAVLEYLGRNYGQVVTRTMLMEQVWGSDFETFSNVIDVYIKNLRNKLKAHTDINLIRTIRGKGYVLKES